MIKTLSQLFIERNFLSSQKLTANVRLDGEKLKAFPLDQQWGSDIGSYRAYS